MRWWIWLLMAFGLPFCVILGASAAFFITVLIFGTLEKRGL